MINRENMSKLSKAVSLLHSYQRKLTVNHAAAVLNAAAAQVLRDVKPSAAYYNRVCGEQLTRLQYARLLAQYDASISAAARLNRRLTAGSML